MKQYRDNRDVDVGTYFESRFKSTSKASQWLDRPQNEIYDVISSVAGPKWKKIFPILNALVVVEVVRCIAIDIRDYYFIGDY